VQSLGLVGGRPLRYRRQNSPQTLAEGLEEYYAANIGRVTPPSSLPAPTVSLAVSHDICHVIFGLDTSAADEAMVNVRTLLSCDVGLADYSRSVIEDPVALPLFTGFGTVRFLWAMAATPARIYLAAADARRMSARWPWVPPTTFHHRALAELRQAFGIHIV
jgi:hypothetical protein